MLRSKAIPTGNPATATVMHRKPSLDFSVTGLVYCSMMMFMGLAAINTQANLLFGVFGLMIGVLLVSGIISRWVLRHVTVRRLVPEYAAVGSRVRISYHIDNRKRWWPTLSVTISELDAPGAFDRQPHAYVMHTAAGMQATVHAEVVPLRRGLHKLERFQVSTSFPFGFIKRALIRRHADTILIHPAQGVVEPRALSRFYAAESSGINQRPREGGNDEFYGAREYRPGDPMRMIHWRRSARTMATRTPTNPGGTLVVKQMTRVAPPRLMLLIDTYAPAYSGPKLTRKPSPEEQVARGLHQQRLEDVERNLAAAASLLSAATKRGLSVGLVAWDGQRWLDVAPEGGKRHRRDLLALLAGMRRNREQDTTALLARGLPRATGDTTAVLISAGRADRQAASDGNGSASTGGRARIRRNLVVVSTQPAELARWVRFDPELDFHAMIREESA